MHRYVRKPNNQSGTSYQQNREGRTQSLSMQYGHLFAWPGLPDFIDFSKVADVAVFRQTRNISGQHALKDRRMQ